MPRPERYQLAFDFRKPAERAQFVYPELATSLHAIDSREPGLGRFVRRVEETVIVASPRDVANHLVTKVYAPFELFDQEELWVLLLNNRNRITHEHLVYRGTINTIQVRQAEIFKEAVRTNAAAIILSHCHPSGDVTPSNADINVTTVAIQAAEILNIELLDHIVVGRENWLSMRTQGLGFAQALPPATQT